jgi:predicted membrane protein
MTSAVYLRVLAFTLILSGICVAVLWLSTVFQPYGLFWLTIAVGLLLVVVRTIVAVYLYQADVRRQMRNTVQNSSTTDACPDFWTLDVQKNACKNDTFSDDKRFRYTVGSGTTRAPVREATDAACATATGQDYPFEHLGNLCEAKKFEA